MAWIDVEQLVAQTPPNRREAQQVLNYLARRAKARFYADENFPRQALSVLRQMGARVCTAQAIGLAGHPDENHAAYALKNGLVLLTCDRDFLNERRFPLIHCPAIFVFDFGSGTVREMRQAFRCLSVVFRTPQFFDKWCKVEAQRGSWVMSLRFQNGTTSRSRHRLWHGRLQEWNGDED